MSKLKIEGKELRAIGFPEGPVISVAMNVMEKNYKHHSKEEALAILRRVLQAPDDYANDEALGLIAKQLIPKEEVEGQNISLNQKGIQFNVFRFAKPEIDIQTTQYGFFSISQERIRYSGDLSVNWEMVEDLDLKLSFYVDYDSRPPGQESSNEDYGTVISIAFEF